MIVTTGYGYFKNSQNHVISKYILSVGPHANPSAGLTQVEVANQQALDFIQIYVAPLTPAQAFDVEEFQIDLLAAFSGDDNILPYYSVVKDLATFKNFAGMSQMVDSLYGAGKITLTEVNTLGTVLAGQCIYLRNF